jgi:AAA family ATP:ADP antiporter
MNEPTRWPWVAGAGGLFGAAVGAGMIVRDCALTCNVGFRLVPFAWIAIALLALPVVALQVALLPRVSFARWQVACPLLVAACLVGFKAWTGLAVDAHPYVATGQHAPAVQVAYLTYYVWADPALVLLATNLVRLAARIYGGTATERALGVLAPATLAGGMGGSALARAGVPALVDAGVQYEHARDGLLLVMALTLCALAALARAATARFPEQPGSMPPTGGVLADAREVLGDPTQLLTGAVLVLTGAASVIVDYLFFWSVTDEVDGAAGRTGWFATFYLVLNGVTLALLLFGTQRLIARLGLTLSLIALPVCLALGGAWTLAAPSLLAVCALRITRDGLVKSLFEPATERLILQVSGPRYAAARTILGGLGFSLGMGLGGCMTAALDAGLGASRASITLALLAVLLTWTGAAWLAGGRAGALARPMT